MEPRLNYRYVRFCILSEILRNIDRKLIFSIPCVIRRHFCGDHSERQQDLCIIGNIRDRKLESLSIFSVDCLIMSSAVSDTKHECWTHRQT